MSKLHRILSSLLVASLGYGMTCVLLNLILPTDYPHQPGDGYRNIVKFICASLVGWLCARFWYRHRAKIDRRDK